MSEWTSLLTLDWNNLQDKQHIRMERNIIQNTVGIISAGVTRFLEKTDMSRKKIAQDLHIDFVSSRYKYNCTVYI